MLKIAICDDSRTDIEMLESAFDKLCQYPIEYDVYFSGEELLTYCTLHDETYHLYIFDIEMPQLNGLELAKKIREKMQRLFLCFLQVTRSMLWMCLRSLHLIIYLSR